MANKNKKPAGSVNVDAVKREVSKMVKEHAAKPQGNRFGEGPGMELAPGSVKRESAREQEMGSAKYRQMIHDHNDKNKHILDSLPFTFPKKKMVRSSENVALLCPRCEALNWGSEFTMAIICRKCKKYSPVENYRREEVLGDGAPEDGS